MTEIVLDNNRIPIQSNPSNLHAFLSELQKKTKQFVYLISQNNQNEIGIMDNLDRIKRGLWRKYKPSDQRGYYFYIDQETKVEYTVYSSEFALKLGNIAYEAPKIVKNTNQPPTQTIVQPQQHQQIAQQPQNINQHSSMLLPEDMSYTSQTNVTRVPIYPQYNPDSMILGNFSFNPATDNQSKKQQKLSTKNMNSRSIQNLNRILAYSSSRQTDIEQQTPIVNSWMQSDTRFNVQPQNYSNKADQTPIVNNWTQNDNRIKNDQAIISGWMQKNLGNRDSNSSKYKNNATQQSSGGIKTEQTPIVNSWMQTDSRLPKQGQINSQFQTPNYSQVQQTPNYSQVQQTPNYSQVQQTLNYSQVQQNYNTAQSQGNVKQNQNYLPQQVQGSSYQQNYSSQTNIQPQPSSTFNMFNNYNEAQRMNMSQPLQNTTEQQFQNKQNQNNEQHTEEFSSRYRYFGPPQKRGKGTNPGNGNIAPQSVETKFSA